MYIAFKKSIRKIIIKDLLCTKNVNFLLFEKKSCKNFSFFLQIVIVFLTKKEYKELLLKYFNLNV
jgi:hypothetical protein